MLASKSVKLALSFAALTLLALALLTPAWVRFSDMGIPAATVSMSPSLHPPAVRQQVSRSLQTTTLLTFRPFRGFCACSCTTVPHCNTSADCGGAACTHSISCCEKPGAEDGLLARNASCANPSPWKID